MLRLGFAVIGVTDMSRAVDFWTAALNLVASDEWQHRLDDAVSRGRVRQGAGLTTQ